MAQYDGGDRLWLMFTPNNDHKAASHSLDLDNVFMLACAPLAAYGEAEGFVVFRTFTLTNPLAAIMLHD